MSVEERRPVVASYCATFLKPEMLHIYRQITALESFVPTVLTEKRENGERFPFDEVRVVPRSKYRWLRRVFQKQLLQRPLTLGRGETRRLKAALDAEGASLLHVYFGQVAVQLLPLLRITGMPTVVSFHGADVLVKLDQAPFRRMTLEMLGRVTLVLARSHSLLAALRDLGCPPEKLRLHRTGIPLDGFPFRARNPPADGEWRLLQACRLIEKKGLAVTLQAFAEFARTWPKARLSIAGTGPLEEALRARAAELGVRAKVEFTGFLSQEALQRKYAEAHFFLHPSEMGHDGNQEGVPNSLLEAMATGLPVFATRHGGIPEAVENAVGGRLVDEGDHAAMAKALLASAADPEQLNRSAQAARKSVEDQFDLHAQARKLEGFYREAIEISGQGRSPQLADFD